MTKMITKLTIIVLVFIMKIMKTIDHASVTK